MRTLSCIARAALLGIAGCAIAGIFTPAVARADDVADAKDLFARGRELRQRGQCAEAIPLFRKAYGLYPGGLGSVRNLAECEESLGHFASARRAWLDLKRELITHTDSKYDGWSQDAEEAAARLAPKLARLTIEVDGAAGTPLPADAVEVTLNAEALPSNLVGTVLDRDPGHYVVRATSPRASSGAEEAVDLAAGDDRHVVLRLATTDTGAPAPAAPEHASEGGTATRRTLGWIALGVGGASLVGAAISGVVFQGAVDDVNAQCPMHVHCSLSQQPTLESASDRGRLAATLVNVLLPVGAALSAGGVALVLTARAQPAQAALVFTPTGLAAIGEF